MFSETRNTSQQSREKSHSELYSQALQLYKNSENKELEKLFSKFLKKSYDVDFWNLYIDYVKNLSTKKVNLSDVYAFVFNHFEGSYVLGEFSRAYINILESSENINTELIRKVYHRSFIPTQSLGLLWSEYEKWEARTNRQTAKTYIDQIQPMFMSSFNMYQRLSPYIESNQFFKIIDIETENPLRLEKKDYEARLSFIFNYYLSKYPSSEPLSFLYSFYLKEIAKEKLSLKTDSVFLSIWYSYQYQSMYFNMEDDKNRDIITINYLNWISKREGIDAVRQKFDELKERVGMYVFVYMATVEFYQGKNKERSYQIFVEGMDRFGENSKINERFFEMFLKTGDDENIRLIFNKIKKTERIWDWMIEYEFQHGELDDYKDLLMRKQNELEECLPAVKLGLLRPNSKGSQGIYEQVARSFGFLDLEIVVSDPIKDFLQRLPELPRNENVLSNLDNSKVVRLLVALSE